MGNLAMSLQRCSGASGIMTPTDVRFCFKIRIRQNSYNEHTSSADMPIMMMSLVITQPSIQLADHL